SEIAGAIVDNNALETNGSGQATATAKQQPARAFPSPSPSPKEESYGGSPPEKSYAFVGKVIRLTTVDHETWRKRYHAIPDLDAELQSLDDFYARNNVGKEWFHRCSTALGKKHQAAVEKATTTGQRRTSAQEALM